METSEFDTDAVNFSSHVYTIALVTCGKILQKTPKLFVF